VSPFCKGVPAANPDWWEGPSWFCFALEGNPGGSFFPSNVCFQKKPQKDGCGVTRCLGIVFGGPQAHEYCCVLGELSGLTEGRAGGN